MSTSLHAGISFKQLYDLSTRITFALAGLLVKYFSVKYPVSFKENVRVTYRIMLIDPGFIFYNTAFDRSDLFTAYFH